MREIVRRSILSVLLALLGLLGCRSRPLPAPAERSLEVDLRSAARAWLLANVRDRDALRMVAGFHPAGVTTEAALAAKLKAAGIEAPLTGYRWRELARDHGSAPDETMAVRLFLVAAMALDAERGQ